MNNNKTITKEEILNLAKQYKTIKKCEIKGESCYITSLSDSEWYFLLTDIPSGRIKLYHKNSLGCKKYHVQRTYYDVPFLMRSIGTHEIHKYKTYKSSLEKAFDKINEENNCRMKIKKIS